MKQLIRSFRWPLSVASMLLLGLVIQTSSVFASPFGQGVYGADVPFGSATSISVALGGNVSLALTPNGSNFVGSGSHTLTITSTDVVGYRLYLYTPGSSSMSSGSDTIPASGNTTAGALSLNSWGYNTTGSTTNYIGASVAPKVLKDANGPFKNGDSTTVTYGVSIAGTKGAGNYSVPVVYTVVAKSQ